MMESLAGIFALCLIGLIITGTMVMIDSEAYIGASLFVVVPVVGLVFAAWHDSK